MVANISHHISEQLNDIPRSMKIALVASALFHVFILLAGTLGLPYISKPPTIAQPIAVELVDVSELTQTNKPPVKSKLKPVPDKPKEEPKPQPKMEAPPKVEAKEPPKIAPLKKPEEKKEDTVKPEPKVPPPPSEKLEKPKPPEKKVEDKKEATETEDPLASLMKNLQEAEDLDDGQGQADAKATNSPDAPLAEFMTQSELGALTNQLVGCWQIPIGAKNVNGMVVDIHIWANSDRTVRRVEIADQWRASNDPAFRALAESAKRAVLDPSCSPLELPMDKLEVWKNQYIVVPFDPSQVT